MLTKLGAAACLLCLVSTSVGAQSEGEVRCDSAFKAIMGGAPAPKSQCQQLATFVISSLSDSLRADTAGLSRKLGQSLPAGAVQSRRGGEAQPAGSPAQTEAVPSVQPTTIASASVAVAGSEAGTDAITSMSFNPAMLLGSSDADAAARWGRFADVTLFFPVTDAGNTTNRLDYFGVRLRLNITGLKPGAQLLKDAVLAFRETLSDEGKLIGLLTPVLLGAGDPEACARAVLEGGFRDYPGVCDADVGIELSPQKYEKLRKRIAAARERADAQYLGLDLRMDTGDPTLGAVPGSDATSLQAGLAFGRRLLKEDVTAPSAGFRSRLGVRYIDPEAVGDVTWALDGGLALEASRMLQNEQFMTVTGGFEFRYSNSEESEREALQTDFLDFRASLNMPLVGGASLAVGFAAPVVGEQDPTLTFNVNWGALLPGFGTLAPAPRTR